MIGLSLIHIYSFVNAVVEAYFYNSKNGGGEYAQKIVTNAKLKVGIVESDKEMCIRDRTKY